MEIPDTVETIDLTQLEPKDIQALYFGHDKFHVVLRHTNGYDYLIQDANNKIGTRVDFDSANMTVRVHW